MHSLTQDFPGVLLSEQEAPCLSIYQPTHRQHPENLQDPIRFRNLVKALKESLLQKHAARDIPALLAPFEALADDKSFWNQTADGLAVLGSANLFRVYRLQRPVTELAIVADSFHIKPLMRIMQSADRYHILGLSKRAFKVFDGNRDALGELTPIEDVPQTANALMGWEEPDDIREGAHRAYGPSGASNKSPQGTSVQQAAGGVARQGTDVKQDADDRDTELFFRAVDRAVLEHYSNPTGQRLILAALPQHHHLFRSVSANPHLIAESIDVHPDDLSISELRERAWKLIQPHYLERLDGFVDRFGAASAGNHSGQDLASIGLAATAGRIETLLIEADRLIPGRLDLVNGTVSKADLHEPGVDDLLDDLGEQVLRKGGEVVVVPTERMPTDTGAAAIFRF